MKKKLIILGSVLLVLSLIIINSFLINPSQLTIRREEMVSPLFNESLNDKVIAFFADTHFDSDNGSQFKKAIKAIKDYNPDIILFGGDLIDDYTKITTEDINEMISELNSFDSDCAKYAVLGNHDIHSDNAYKMVLEIFEKSNFQVLENKSVHVYLDNTNYLNLVGLACYTYKDVNVSEAYQNVSSDHYTIALMHEPDVYSLLPKDKTNYALAGHSHGGQVYIPLFNFLYRPIGAKDYFRGKYNNNSIPLDITNGVGFTKKKARLFADCEVVIYKLSTY